MTTDTLVTIGVSVVTSFLTAFGLISWKMGRYAEKIDQLEKCDLQKRISTLEGQYSVASLTQRKSPISLTEQGKDLLNKSGAKAFVDANKQALIDKIRATGIKTAYDVQEKAKDVVKSYHDDPLYIPLKDFAFREGVDLYLLDLVASLYLRDNALPEFGYTHEEVDKTDPANGTKTHEQK